MKGLTFKERKPLRLYEDYIVEIASLEDRSLETSSTQISIFLVFIVVIVLNWQDEGLCCLSHPSSHHGCGSCSLEVEEKQTRVLVTQRRTSRGRGPGGSFPPTSADRSQQKIKGRPPEERRPSLATRLRH